MKASQATLPPRFHLSLAALFGLFFSVSALATPPSVSISSPADGFVWNVVGGISVTATATDADGRVERVEFYLDSVLMASSTIQNVGTLVTFAAALRPRPAPGTYTLTARAYDDAGEVTISAARTLSVPVLPPPAVITGSAEPGATRAILNGAVNPKNHYILPRDVSIQFGLSTGYEGVSFVAQSQGAYPENLDSPVTAYLYGLERNTTYHYRIVATTYLGLTVRSEDATFTTGANTPPTASDAFANVPSAAPTPVYCDFEDLDFEPVTITSFTAPSHGSVTIGSTEPGGDFTYTPDATFDGQDEFTYTVSDEHGGTATAKVYLTNYRKKSVGRYATTIMVDYGNGPRRAVGALGLDVTAMGRFTGVVRFFAERYPIRGQFSVDGFCQLEIDRVGGPALALTLYQGGSRDGIVISGYVGGLGAYEIIGDTALVFPTAAPEAGAYTFALPPNRDDLPQGNGFVTGRVSRSGAISFVGRIGDGQAFSFGSQLRRGGSAQFYVVAGTEPRDRLSGRLQFPSDAGTEASGNFVWFKAPRTSGFFQSGFTSELTILGSRLDVSDADEPILDYTGATPELEIEFTDAENDALLDGLLAGLGENSLEFTEPTLARAAVGSRTRTAAVLPKVEFKISRARGLFSGTFRNPAEGGRLRSFGGVFLQHQNSGTGLFIVGGRTGTVTITPR